MPPSSKRFRFPASRRLHGRREFARVYAGRVRTSAGPLVVHGRPNGLEHHRLGLSVSKRVGIAVVRNRIKRLVREAFRLNQRAWPGGYDIVVVVRPHEPATLGQYEQMLLSALGRLDRRWRKASPS